MGQPLRSGTERGLSIIFVASLVMGTTMAIAPRSAYAAATGSWSATGSMTTPRFVYTATLLPNGKVLAAGGHSGTGVLSSAELYDPAAGTWSATGSMSTPRCVHTATLLANGKVLAAGGQPCDGSGASITGAELYDPAAGTWSATGSMSTPRFGHTATLLANGKVLVAGGSTGCCGFAFTSAELYDPAAGTWSATGSMITGSYEHTATLLPNGKVLVTGGTEFSSVFSRAELYDPAAGTWSATGSMSTPRDGHKATLLASGKVLVAGGRIDRTGSPSLSSAELYDPAAGTWSATGSMTTGRSAGYTATLLATGNVLAAGGVDGSGAVTASAELYDPASATWSATSSMSTPRTSHTATLLPNGRALAAGGQSGTGVLSSAELFVTGAAAQTSDLVGTIQGLNLPAGTATSLLAKLSAVLQSIALGDTVTACNQLGAFINEVHAQSGKKISAADAAALIATASQIRATLGCP